VVERDACRACRSAVAGLPLLNDVRNCAVGARGSRLQSREALGVTLCARDSDAAWRGSMAVVRGDAK
jgi:hypothetical protein